jgi:anti-anti-sigma factor
VNAALAKPIRLSMSSHPACLSVVRSATGKFCEILGFESAAIGEAVASVDEALTNIIRHAYGGDEGKTIDIELSPLEGGGGLRVTIRDYGPGAQTDRIKARNLEGLVPGGMGLHIIGHCMDRVEYRPAEGGGTMLVMEKDPAPPRERTITMNREPTQSTVRSVRRIGQDAVVEAAGDIDLGRSQEFQQALLALVEENPKRIVVDLSGVPYMDSSGVASLVKLLSRVRKIGSSLYLVGMNDRVRSIFEITRLDKVFDIRKSQQEALEAP